MEKSGSTFAKKDSSLSQFELLPRELFAMIIEYVPESIPKLSLVSFPKIISKNPLFQASKNLKAQVEDFASGKTIFRLVDKIEIAEESPGMVHFQLSVIRNVHLCSVAFPRSKSS